MNYFIECCALGSILIGLAPLPSASLPRFGVLAGFAAVVLIPCVFNLTIGLGAFNRVNTASEATLVATLTETPPDLPIVADGKWIAGVVGAERTPIVNDPYSFRQMSDNGMIDQSPVVAALERGMVGAVIFDRPIDAQFKNPMLHWPIPVLEVIAQKYALVHQGESIYVYLPKTEIARRARRSESGLRAKTY